MPVVLAAALLAAACKSNVVAVEEAQEVAATLGQAVELPASVEVDRDVTEILDVEQGEDQKRSGRSNVAQDQSPPQTDDPWVLARFYFERAGTAERQGDTEQWRSDSAKALVYLGDVTVPRGGRQKVKQYFRIHRRAIQAAAHSGSRKQALDYIREAIGEAESIGAWPQLVDLYSRLVGAQLSMGGVFEARRAAEKLGEVLRDGQRTERWRRIPQDKRRHLKAAIGRTQAGVAARLGQHREAEALLRAALAEVEATEKGQDSAFYDSTLAKLATSLRALGRYGEAETEARRALTGMLRRHGRERVKTVSVMNTLTKIFLSQGRFDDAAKMAGEALATLDVVGVSRDSLPRAQSRRTLAKAYVALEQWDAGIAEFESIRDDLSTAPELFEHRFRGDVDWSIALMRVGRIDHAIAMLEPKVRTMTRKLAHRQYDIAVRRGVLAALFVEKGALDAAAREFKESIPVLLSQSARARGESGPVTLRETRLRLIYEAYLTLLSRVAGTDRERAFGFDAVEEGFRIADVVRSQSVQRAIAESGARAATRESDLATTVRREQDMLLEISALRETLSDLLSSPPQEQNPEAIEAIRERIDLLERSHEILARGLEEDFPQYADLVGPAPATLDDVRQVLRPGEALVAVYAGRHQTHVWAVPKTGPVASATVDLGREALAHTVGGLRAALEPQIATLGDIPEFDVATAQGLYAQILQPVEAGWRSADSLIVVPHGALGYLPPSLLATEPMDPGPARKPLFGKYRDVPWLARSHAVTMLPSVASFKTLRSRHAAAQQRRSFIGFGDPYFNAEQASAADGGSGNTLRGGASAGAGLRLTVRSRPRLRQVASADVGQLPRLEETGAELRSIARSLGADPEADVYLGRGANEDRVKTMDLSAYRVIAFATHGLVPGDLPGLDQPALALSAPNVAGVAEDGLLTMEEILGLELNADWTVLSACNTAAADGKGAEAVSGLGRAFFYAGARALLVSNWPVHSASAKDLTTDTFRRQAADPALSRAEALRQAMLGLMDGPGYVDAQGRTVFSYAHPIFWAPFSLVGDGGGAAAHPDS